MRLFPWKKVRAGRLVVAGGAGCASLVLAVASSFADGDDVAPAPASIGADVPVTYFGPPPSATQPELVGPYQLLKAGKVDLEAGTIQLPLYRGVDRSNGKAVWYVLTDTTDAENAAALGLNFSGKLQYATCRAARRGWLEADATIAFENGAVDFAPARALVPGEGPNAFPPKLATPGAVGDEFYSPLVRLENAGNHVYNAPVVAYGVEEAEIDSCDAPPNHDLVHDKVVRLCPREHTVTLALTTGFSFAKPVLYLSTEASDPVAATLEGATLAPGLRDAQVGGDDSAFSPVERIFLTLNGPTGLDNPQRQGLNSALTEGRGPLNVLGGIPTVATDYSPLWDVNLGEWSADAVELGYRARVTEEFQILGLVANGWITGPGGAPYGSTGIIVNCPIVHRFL